MPSLIVPTAAVNPADTAVPSLVGLWFKGAAAFVAVDYPFGHGASCAGFAVAGSTVWGSFVVLHLMYTFIVPGTILI